MVGTYQPRRHPGFEQEQLAALIRDISHSVKATIARLPELSPEQRCDALIAARQLLFAQGQIIDRLPSSHSSDGLSPISRELAATPTHL
jgi:hypothetical protein